jgi:hypothetical protein
MIKTERFANLPIFADDCSLHSLVIAFSANFLADFFSNDYYQTQHKSKPFKYSPSGNEALTGMVFGLVKLVNELHLFAGIQRGPGQHLFKGFHIHSARAGVCGQQAAAIEQLHPQAVQIFICS